MPAVTADTLTLPRLPGLSPTSTEWRGVTKVVTAHRQLEGEGFVVRRPFPGMDLSLADPFLLLDHMGAVEYAPGEAKGAPWHPHRGFETVTYMMDGTFEHSDSNGGGGVITNGDTQWMTAGAGILFISWTRFGDTLGYLLPTGATLSALGDDLDGAWRVFQDVKAPAPVVNGFIVATAIAIWFLAFVADWAAFRARAAFEALLPATTLFLFAAALGAPGGRVASAAVFAAAALLFVLLHRTLVQEESSTWAADRENSSRSFGIRKTSAASASSAPRKKSSPAWKRASRSSGGTLAGN